MAQMVEMGDAFPHIQLEWQGANDDAAPSAETGAGSISRKSI